MVSDPDTDPSVLVVCTANICRSPAAARLLTDLLGSGVAVRSAGVLAPDGQPACAEASRWLRDHHGHGGGGRHRREVPEHLSRRLTAADVRQASLVLTAAREHRQAVLRLMPAAQAHTFTLAQAARLADWRSRQDVARPDGAEARVRLAWLVHELEGARGLAPLPVRESEDDVPDPHVDPTSHEQAMRQVYDAVHSLARLLTGDPFPSPVVSGPLAGPPR